MTTYPSKQNYYQTSKNCCMASGGGGHPSHLSITTPSSHNQITSHSCSLQTPDTSALFISSLGNSLGSGNSFAPSPLDHPQSFTSLEELLNVTGINSLELDQSGVVKKSDHGVGSLQQMAREVEERDKPPSKRLCPDTDSTPYQTPNQIPSNIGVQPLHTFTSSISTTTLPQTTISPSSWSLTTPIVSLLDKKTFATTSNHLNTPSTSSSTLLDGHTLFTPVSSPQMSNLPPPPPYDLNGTSSISVSTGPSPSMPHARVSLTSHGYTNTLPNQFPVASQTQLQTGSGRQSQLTQSLTSTSDRTRYSVAQNSAPTSASRTADSVNSNSKAVVIQLMQLYKQYQNMNDQQGMARVRNQLSLLVSAQQRILAAQNSLAKTGGTQSSNAGNVATGSSGVDIQPPLGHQSNVPKTVSMGVNVSGSSNGEIDFPSIQPQQQPYHRSHRILDQLNMIAKTSQLSSSLKQNTGASSTPWQDDTVSSSLPPPPPYSGTNVTSSCTMISTSHTSGSGLGSVGLPGRGVVLNTPPSLLSHVSASSTITTPSTQNHVLGASQADTQRAVKQIQMLMASLPDSKRPKTIQELKEFIQRYSSLVTKGINTPPTTLSNSSLPKMASLPVVSSTSSQFASSLGHVADNTRTQYLQNTSGQSSLVLGQDTLSQTSDTSPAAHVAEHFRNSLLTSANKSSGSIPSQKVSSRPPLFASQLSSVSSPALSVNLSKKLQHQQQPLSSDILHAPVTTQFKQSGSSLATAQSSAQIISDNKPNSVPATSSTSNQLTSTKIQAGVAMPLPPGLTLETLGVLCRLPESELIKLKLPQALLPAIRVWKARQFPGIKAKISSVSNKNNIPVLIPPSELPSSSAASNSSSMVTFTKPAATLHHGPVKANSGQPNVIPSGVGFPPRSLHVCVPGPSSSVGQHQASSNHMTRYKLKMEQQKVKNERLQALQKALQSSEEARIAFRFSAHLEKMHSQLLNPDTINSFRSQHDILARLLPYHLYSEPEPPPAAVEKADAVFESVAQVLLSRSRGLKSRFEQITMKSEAEGGSEQREMRFQLEKLFMEGEQERIRKEDLEKKQAEQIAADLSLMADNVGSFDPDFSLGDVFSPLMSMDSGIT